MKTTRAPYCVEALDAEGYTDLSSLGAAKGFARLYLSDKELLAAGLHKVEITNMNGECEWDAFVEPAAGAAAAGKISQHTSRRT